MLFNVRLKHSFESNKQMRYLLLLTCLSAIPSEAFETIDTTVIFPGPAQGHGSSGLTGVQPKLGDAQLVLFRGSEINRLNGPLPFRSMYRYLQGSCDELPCQITSTQVPSIDLTKPENLFQQRQGTQDVTRCPTVALGSDGTVTFADMRLGSGACEVNFSSGAQNYWFRQVSIGAGVTLNLQPGDYWFESLRVDGGKIELSGGGTYRIFVKDDFDLYRRGQINANGDPRWLQLFLYGRDNNSADNSFSDQLSSYTFTQDTQFKGFLYANGAVILSGAQVEGSVTAKRLVMLLKAKITGLATAATSDAEIALGRQAMPTVNQSVRVNFDRPFSQVPVIFLMPQIQANETNAQPPFTFDDGPATVRVTRVDQNGFYLEQVQPRQTPAPVYPMTQVDWLALLPGKQRLADGRLIYVGKKKVSAYQGNHLSDASWDEIQLPDTFANLVALTQRQTNNSNCWLTDALVKNSQSIQVALEVSEVVNDANTPKCVKVKQGQFPLKNLQEEVAYLLTEAGNGQFSIADRSYRYQFGTGQTGSGTLTEQCHLNNATNFSPTFSTPPLLVASKNSRNSNNGGWLRRCFLTHETLIQVVDEDVYQDSERTHVAESYSFVALENPHVKTLDHFQLRYPQVASVCAPASVTIKACANPTCSQLYTDPVVVDLVPSQGWPLEPVTVNNGETDVLFTPVNLSGAVTLGIASSQPSALMPYTCYRDGILDASCTMEAAQRLLNFDVPTHVAGQMQSVIVEAIDGSFGQSCLAAVTGAQTLDVSFRYLQPDTGAGQVPQINGITLDANASTPIPFTFDNQGKAVLAVSYADAGVLALTLGLTDNSVTPALSLQGTDIFAVLPQAIELTSSEANAVCSGTDDSSYAQCSVFKKAGESFTLNAQAVFTENGTQVVTPNFKTTHLSTPPAIIPALLAPVEGSTAHLLITPLLMQQGSDQTTRALDDVGVYQFGVLDFVPYPDYQDEQPQLTVPIAYSEPIGRFIPDSLRVELLATGEFSPTCTQGPGFSYVGQAMTYAQNAMPVIRVQGMNAADEITANYQGLFAKLASVVPSWTFNQQTLGTDAQPLAFTADIKPGSWLESAPGVHDYTFSVRDRFTVNKTPLAQLPPFLLALTVTQNSFTDLDDVETENQIQFSPLGHEMRFAKLVLKNASGLELEDLPMPVYLAYQGLTGDVVSTDDHCTQLNPTWLKMNNQAPGDFVNIPLEQGAGHSSASYFVANTANCGHGVCIQAQSGDFGFRFNAPGAGNTGQIRVIPQNTMPLWLYQVRSDQLVLPDIGRASFGFFRGNDRLNFKREAR